MTATQFQTFVKASDGNACNSLHLLAIDNNLEMADCLVDLMAQFDEQLLKDLLSNTASNGFNALHIACAKGFASFSKFILDTLEDKNLIGDLLDAKGLSFLLFFFSLM